MVATSFTEMRGGGGVCRLDLHVPGCHCDPWNANLELSLVVLRCLGRPPSPEDANLPVTDLDVYEDGNPGASRE